MFALVFGVLVMETRRDLKKGKRKGYAWGRSGM